MEDDDNDNDDDYYLSLGEQISITVVASFSAVLSIVGSGLIVWMICNDWKNKIQKLKYRLLLSLSICDIINSLVFTIWSLPVPMEYSHQVWGARGNKTTCNVQGFFLQFGIIGSFYNAALSAYFMLCLCYHMSDLDIAQKYERATHATAIVWSFGTSVVALLLDTYAFGPLGCWIAPEPRYCVTRDHVPCERGQRAYLWAWVFTGGPLAILLCFIMYTMYKIYQKVKSISEKAEQISFQSSERRFQEPSAEHFQEPSAEQKQGPSLGQKQDRRNDTRECDSTTQPMKLSSSQRKTTRQEKRKSRHQNRIRQTAIQAVLYVVAYAMTHMWAFVCVIIEQTGARNPFYTLFLENMFWPLQGFMNVFIFLRPRIQAIQKEAAGDDAHDDLSYAHAAFLAIFYYNDNTHGVNYQHQRQPNTGGRRFRFPPSSSRRLMRSSRTSDRWNSSGGVSSDNFQHHSTAEDGDTNKNNSNTTKKHNLKGSDDAQNGDDPIGENKTDGR